MRSWKASCYVIYTVWSQPITLKSNFAREWAEDLVWATSRNYITSEIAPYTKEYGNTYKVTPNGLLFLQECFDGIAREAILEIIHGELDQAEDLDDWPHGPD